MLVEMSKSLVTLTILKKEILAMSPRLKSVYNACHKTWSGIAIGEISDATPTDSIGLATREGRRISVTTPIFNK